MHQLMEILIKLKSIFSFLLSPIDHEHTKQTIICHETAKVRVFQGPQSTSKYTQFILGFMLII
jgi:hypothetical protein